MTDTEYTQARRGACASTVLGPDVLLLDSLRGRECVSEPFRFELGLLSEDRTVDLEALIGEPICAHLDLPHGAVRHVNGIVTQVWQGAEDERFARYRVEVRPWLWLLTRTADCRIFQRKSPLEIVARVFGELGFADHELRTQGRYEPREYCVQYRESDFDFVSRLLEEEGIFYFFEHRANGHTLVLADSPAAAGACAGESTARIAAAAADSSDDDRIESWELHQRLHSGVVTFKDYNFEDPAHPLDVRVQTREGNDHGKRLEIYDYHPQRYGRLRDGEVRARLRMEAEESEAVLAAGRSSCRVFAPGHRFTLRGHYRSDFNADYMLVAVEHDFEQPAPYESSRPQPRSRYSNRFTCVPTAATYRPRRAHVKPVVAGPQTAVVVGPENEEIHVDEYGRVKVQFPWDREGTRDQDSSCWMRVSQAWAGKSWGAVAHPRVGDEVVVEFLEGDPDQPIVTGRVHNARRMPPYGAAQARRREAARPSWARP